MTHNLITGYYIEPYNFDRNVDLTPDIKKENSHNLPLWDEQNFEWEFE